MEKEIYSTKLIISFECRILKKSYCAICGNKLKRKITLIEKNEKYYPFGVSLLKERELHKSIILPVYKCKNCRYEIEYNNQKKINVQQKRCGFKKIPEGAELIKKYSLK